MRVFLRSWSVLWKIAMLLARQSRKLLCVKMEMDVVPTSVPLLMIQIVNPPEPEPVCGNGVVEGG